ncbi:suppressor APC domain-containing protein 2 [Episyrphus balteatus]|uniref:suppressor APC domain-containing protein 2 n=1 Tax=Episyrphus balteatus TaxID=286459 RepID=UPI0024860C92|nr:suppressor APC domain-containing protein 2 [Episyrphus balteatus]
MMHRQSTQVLGVSNVLNSNNCGASAAAAENPTDLKGHYPLETLPKQFVVSMKKLFDILDDQRTGYVKFSDIQKGWQDDGCKGLPRGVIESLRKVTPTSGLLSFDRFCAGLKICLLQNQQVDISNAVRSDKPPRPPSAPLLDIENPVPNAQWSNTNCNTATVRPNNIISNQRALSLPQLSPEIELDIMTDTELAARDIYSSPPPPPKPPRSAMTANNANAIDKAEIRHALQNWQMGILMNEMDSKDKRKSFQVLRGTADGGSSTTPDSGAQSIPNGGYQKKRREPRRHTLQNGIDYNMLKRMKQFEEERDVLLQGLAAVEKAREWYLQQISNAQEKIKYLGRMGSHVEQWSEVHQERLDFQRARVLEINRHLSTLAETWERGGFPTHINLAIRPTNHQGLLQPVDRLRQQNRNLTNEVNQKTDRIAMLEREKQTLIRELLELQKRNPNRGGGLISVVSQGSQNCMSSSGLVDADVVY